MHHKRGEWKGGGQSDALGSAIVANCPEGRSNFVKAVIEKRLKIIQTQEKILTFA